MVLKIKVTKSVSYNEILNSKIINIVQRQFNLYIYIQKKYIQKKNKLNVDSLRENHKEFIKSSKLILKKQQRFKSERYNFLTEDINKIALSLNVYKRMQSIDSMGTNISRTSKDLLSEKEGIKCNNIIKHTRND